MIYASFRPTAEEHVLADRTGLGMTILTAVGTSVDAAAIGVTFALNGVTVWITVAVGVMSFVTSAFGFYVGPYVGTKLGRYAEAVGGIVLIVIGLLIFTKHMEFFVGRI